MSIPLTVEKTIKKNYLTIITINYLRILYSLQSNVILYYNYTINHTYSQDKKLSRNKYNK